MAVSICLNLLVLLMLFAAATAAGTAEERSAPEPPLFALEEINDDFADNSDDKLNKLVAAVENLAKAVTAGFEEQRRTVGKLAKSLRCVTAQYKYKNRPLCPPPWDRFGGFCLHYTGKEMNWTTARAYCKSLGGDLVWFKSRGHHDVINLYMISKNIGWWYHVGFFRADNNAPLTWTKGRRVIYHGNPLKHSEMLNFSSFPRRTTLSGDPADFEAPSLCRRF